MKIKSLFLLSWKKLLLILAAEFFSIILHNFIYAIFNLEEAFFFIVAVILIPLYFIISIIYSLAYLLLKKKK